MPWRGLHLAVATLVVAAGATFAASPSEAARYHRFKRVNGQWLEGRFPSQPHRHASRLEIRREAASRVRERRAAAAKVAAEARRHPDTTSSLRPIPVEPPARLVQEAPRDLMAALRRKAAERAVQLAQGTPSPGNGTEPVSVTLNFKTGMKATSFRNGDVSKEPFDPAALRALAASPPPPIHR